MSDDQTEDQRRIAAPGSSGEVALTFDTQALKRSLRFAFSNRYSVLQELIQNARRAGATRIWIDTRSGEAAPDGVVLETVSVKDNGCGIGDLRILFDVARSGWDDTVRAAEGPYGLGFLSAIYGAKRVKVASLGMSVDIDADQLLAGGTVSIQREASGACGSTCRSEDTWTTEVCLMGYATLGVAHACQGFALGYPIPIVLNGVELPRPDSENLAAPRTAVGTIDIRGGLSRGVRIYLQGFKVFEERHYASDPDIVHLDATRWHGKFPDRDRVINEDVMLREVKEARRLLYLERLEAAKARLDPVAFMERWHRTAAELDRLEIFNDINIVPASWFKVFDSLPAHEFSGYSFLADDVREGHGFSRDEIAEGAVVVAKLDSFYAGDSDQDDCNTAWLYAYAAGAQVLSKEIDKDHWLHDMIRVHVDVEARLEAVGPIRSCEADSRRLRWLGPVQIQLCRDAQVRLPGYPPLSIGEAVADGGTSTILVPVGADEKASYVSSDVLRQLESYEVEERLDNDALEEDERAINEMVRELLTDDPKKRLALSLEAALGSYSSIRNLLCCFTVDADGGVKVQDLVSVPTQPDSTP